MRLSDRRIGIFSVSCGSIEDYINDVGWLLSKVLVLRAEYDPCVDGITYTAICPAFTTIPRGQPAPVYEVSRCVEMLNDRGDYRYRIDGFIVNGEKRTWLDRPISKLYKEGDGDE